MLNLFLLFTDTFLLCRFFLAWLIPQLLQKSQMIAKLALLLLPIRYLGVIALIA